MSGARVPEWLADRPPSRKLVYLLLEAADEPLTQTALAERAQLDRRAVRDALSDLEAAGVVEKRVRLGDARERVYHPVEPAENADVG